MKIDNTINRKVLYLEDMDGLTLAGNVSTPTRITLSETDGDTIFSAIQYGDFSGLIHLDLAKILKEYTSPPFPTDEWSGCQDQVLDLTFKISTPTYTESFAFTLNCFSREATTMMSDIDVLDVPMFGMLPLPVTIHAIGETATIIRRRVKTEEELSEEKCDNLGLGVSTKFIFTNTLDDACQFCILVNQSAGPALKSPVYRPTSGQFELFLFRNRFGAMELFPMSGDLHLSPNYKFDVGKVGAYSNSALKTEEITLTQYTGPLSRQASKVLASMLADGYAFHYVNGDWKRIIITEAKFSLKRSDFTHRQSFSFRYQEPVEIRDINI